MITNASFRLLLLCCVACTLLHTSHAGVEEPLSKTPATEKSPFAGMTELGMEMLDTQMDMMSEPARVAKFAHLQRLYFDAIQKEGFTREEAIRILTTPNLLPHSGK